MVSVPTPIPKSTWQRLRKAASGRPLDLLWKLLVTVVLLTLIIVTTTLGQVFGPVIAFAVLSALLSDNIRNAVSDLYNRQFHSASINVGAFFGSVRDTLLFWR